MNKNDMLESAKTGCVESINRLLQQSQRYVATIISLQLNAEMTRRLGVEDLTQDVCFRIVRDLRQCRADSWDAYLGWVRRVTVNHIIRSIEGANAQKRSGQVARIDCEFDMADQRPGPCAIIESRETYAAVMRMAAGKGERTRRVVEMLSSGHKTAEIASAMQQTHCAISSVMKRFRDCAMQS